MGNTQHSQLDRLLILLQKGKTDETRLAAARQIGQFQRTRPHQLHFLLQRILSLLLCDDWDTRCAAAAALEEVAEAVPQWKPLYPTVTDIEEENNARRDAEGAWLNLESFDMDLVLRHGKPLLASGGTEFEECDVNEKPRERLMRHRRLLLARLGLDERVATALGSADSMEELVQETDLDGRAQSSTRAVWVDSSDEEAAAKVCTQLDDSGGQLSARARNALRRRVKRGLVDGSALAVAPTSGATQARKRNRADAPAGGLSAASVDSVLVETVADDEEVAWTEAAQWPFEPLCAELRCALFHPKWQRRHGAAAGLRAVLKWHAVSAGSVCSVRREVSASLQLQWLTDCAIRLLCVLSLDRFGDWASGERVVAPVRETAAQALSILLRPAPAALVSAIAASLQKMVKQPTWELRMSGLLGLKYLLGVRSDLLAQLMPHTSPTLLDALTDDADDVRCASAEALCALVPQLPLLVECVPQLLCTLWQSLSMLDDLSTSAVSVMRLLSESCVVLPYETITDFSLSKTTPPLTVQGAIEQLWPFFHHNSATSRVTAITTLERILGAAASAGRQPSWLHEQLGAALESLYVCLTCDPHEDVHAASAAAWHRLLDVASPAHLAASSSPRLSRWIDVATLREGSPLPSTLAGIDCASAPLASDEMRERASSALGSIASATPSTQDAWVASLLRLLSAPSATSRQVGAWITRDWAFRLFQVGQMHQLEWIIGQLQPSLLSVMEESESFIPKSSELAALMSEMQSCADSLVYAFCGAGAARSDLLALCSSEAIAAVDVRTAHALCGSLFDQFEMRLPPRVTAADRQTCVKARERLLHIVAEVQQKQSTLQRKVAAAAAEAITSLRALPPKLSAFIRSLMRAVEEAPTVSQRRAARSLAEAIEALEIRTPNPVEKVVNNLCKLLTKLPQATIDDVGEAHAQHIGKHAAEGAKLTLANCCRRFGEVLFDKLPTLWVKLEQPLSSQSSTTEELLESLLIIIHLLPEMDTDPATRTVQLLPGLFGKLTCSQLPDEDQASVCDCELRPLRKGVAAAIARCCYANELRGMDLVICELLPSLNLELAPIAHVGIVLALRQIVSTLELRVVPYAALLVTPLISSLSAQCVKQREEAGATFALLMPFLSLEPNMPNPAGMSDILCERKARESSFVRQLLGVGDSKPPRCSSAITCKYEIPVPVNAELRRYQREGVDWLAFLKQFGLHGILCDDMGLGKTLQALCILASTAHEHRASHATHSMKRVPSLVVCPPSLTSHWVAESIKYFGDHLRSIEYVGSMPRRKQLWHQINQHDLVVTTYDVVRADADLLLDQQFDYCILDEGHMIKNAKSKTTIAVKRLRSRHRLLLSGTPIQNSSLELWSLFDFLMPGYLGTQVHFNLVYGRPIQASLGSKGGDAAHVAGDEALRRLHKQVLPFCLRRTKEQVLKELPPKIIEDRMCELHPLQQCLYKAINRLKIEQTVMRALSDDDSHASVEPQDHRLGFTGSCTKHVFAALQYLRKVCNHPLLVLKDADTSPLDFEKAVVPDGGLHSLEVSPKLVALQEILLECGIGRVEASSQDTDNLAAGEAVPTSHRALIFCQSREMLDIVASDLLNRHMPSVSYLRLDGSVPAARRFNLVSRFNHDPSYDLMLLTTSVGGIGLNLTSADIVIFVDHDWNPMKDLQAMDRAHRIGQTRAVNVFRLITRNTLEEKIMGLQKFKQHIASSVVNQQNSHFESMQTDQLLDLFEISPVVQKEPTTQIPQTSRTQGLQGLLDEIGELWSEEQYESQFNVQSFLANL